MDWMALLKQIFEIAIIPLLGIATTYLCFLIKTKIDQLKERTDNETIQKYLDMLSGFVIDAVISTNQTYVNSLKESGSFDAEAQKKAFQMTKDKVLSMLTEDVKEALESFIGDLDTYVNSLIETTVNEHREEY